MTVEIDPTTNLPLLPEGYRWYVKKGSKTVPKDTPGAQLYERLWHESGYVRYSKSDYAEYRLYGFWVTIQTFNDKAKKHEDRVIEVRTWYGGVKKKTVTEEITLGPESDDAWFSTYYEDLFVGDLTKDAILETATKVAEKFYTDRANKAYEESLLGAYPPKSL